VSCHDQGTSVKQGCAGAPGGGSPGTLERANVAGVRESVVAVASQLIEMAAQPDDPAGGWPLPYRSQSRTRPAGTIVSRGISRASPSGYLRPQRPIVPVGGARGAHRHSRLWHPTGLRQASRIDPCHRGDQFLGVAGRTTPRRGRSWQSGPCRPCSSGGMHRYCPKGTWSAAAPERYFMGLAGEPRALSART
jgi:hypothetical protein